MNAFGKTGVAIPGDEAAPAEASSAAQQSDWYKDAIIYQLHIKAFHDSNGDGIGDFNGLLQRLDYIERLG